MLEGWHLLGTLKRRSFIPFTSGHIGLLLKHLKSGTAGIDWKDVFSYRLTECSSPGAKIRKPLQSHTFDLLETPSKTVHSLFV